MNGRISNRPNINEVTILLDCWVNVEIRLPFKRRTDDGEEGTLYDDEKSYSLG